MFKSLVLVACLACIGPCSPDGAELKKVLPDAIETECGECSEKQKEGSKKIFKFLIEQKPEEWKALEGKYDPSGTYKKKFEATLKSMTN
ncbi:ejaculatory bulb-specific protein 3-like [Diaphorina citri]|uniref:Ejaculatory bulb-specific protein 3-like n=1 Tax=Diaphorina citri TaxID=121845 RepID=A0A1S3DIA7_DIACI|nr:ejaculatory bulb-specific protein 3-like [Diaphorina citri]